MPFSRSLLSTLVLHGGPCAHRLGPPWSLQSSLVALVCRPSLARAGSGPEGPPPALSCPLPPVGLRSLRFLILHSNLLTSVPSGLAHLPLLARLDLRDNQLRDVPPELLDAPFARLQGNPLGKALPASHSAPGRPVAGKGQPTDGPGRRYQRSPNSLLVLPRDTCDPRNAQTVPELRLGQVRAGRRRGQETHVSALLPCP